MNATPTSSVSESSKGRAERSNQPSLHALARNLSVSARLWLGKVVSFPFARVLMIFVIGFAAGVAWQSYGGEARKTVASWSPHLAWLAPPAAAASSERLKIMSLALAAARQNLDKLATEMSRLPAQDGDTPRRRANR
jgi:hypothetical protein